MSRVSITVKNSPNTPSVYIRLCKHRKKVFHCFYKINFNAAKNEKKKKIHFIDQNVSYYNINLTMAFLNWPMKTYIWKSGDQQCAVFTTRFGFKYSSRFKLKFGKCSFIYLFQFQRFDSRECSPESFQIRRETQKSLRHTTYFHVSTPLGQSERA